MNKELLKQLYCIFSPSGSERKMRRFIRKQVLSYGCIAETDMHGNLFVTKGVSDTYPCLASHMDQVQDRHSKDFACGEINGAIFGYSRVSREQQGLGADDKNGIFICLECLKKFDVIKCAFFVGEEVGCKGSSACSLDFFKDCRFIIEPDRKGHSDLITSMFGGSVCSEDFVDAICAKEFGYSKETGSITDVGTLVDRSVGISCLNLSCGYYEPHTDHEFTILSELENCLNFVQHIIETCATTYPFERKKYDYGGYYSKYYRHDTYDPYDDDFEIMSNIMMENPGISFEDLYDFYKDSFFSTDKAYLSSIYEDVWYWYNEDDCGNYFSDTYYNEDYREQKSDPFD